MKRTRKGRFAREYEAAPSVVYPVASTHYARVTPDPALSLRPAVVLLSVSAMLSVCGMAGGSGSETKPSVQAPAIPIASTSVPLPSLCGARFAEATGHVERNQWTCRGVPSERVASCTLLESLVGETPGRQTSASLVLECTKAPTDATRQPMWDRAAAAFLRREDIKSLDPNKLFLVNTVKSVEPSGTYPRVSSAVDSGGGKFVYTLIVDREAGR
jgi:hypothetical protein